MRVIKAFLVGATGLIVIITLFSLIIPSRVMVSRAVVINNTNSDEVYTLLANFENWKKWHPVFTVDSAKFNWHTATYNKKDSMGIIKHRGKIISLQIISANKTSVTFLLSSPHENDVHNDIIITDLQPQHAVQVEWRAITKLHWYPWEKFYGIFVDKLMGPGYEAALNGLKDFIEKSPLSRILFAIPK